MENKDAALSQTPGSQQKSDPRTPAPQGVGGWLWLPVATLTLAPFYIAWRAIRNARTAASIVGDETPLDLGLTVFLEFIVTTAMLAASLWVLYLLYNRKPAFPRAFVAFLLGGIVMGVVGVLTTMFVLGSEIEVMLYPLELWDFRGLLGSIVWAAIWIPYMQRSQRVKNTFVN